MITAPQAVGAVAGWLLRGKRRLAAWAWPAVAAATFAIGWYEWWNIPTKQVVAEGGRVCGAAGALLIVPLVIFTPLNAVLAAILQWVMRLISRGREGGAS